MPLTWRAAAAELRKNQRIVFSQGLDVPRLSGVTIKPGTTAVITENRLDDHGYIALRPDDPALCVELSEWGGHLIFVPMTWDGESPFSFVGNQGKLA